MKMTPELNAKGFFEFAAPWSNTQGITYTCLAVRSFEDIYKLGYDVYDKYYAPVGLTNGREIGGKPFNFEEESKLKPNIITLKGSDGSVLYIPDTFIKKLPDKSVVPYSEVILGVSLGLLPDTENLTSLTDDVAALIANRANINASVHVCKLSTVDNPTAEEHNRLQALRFGTPPTVRPNTQMLLEDALKQVELRDLKIEQLLNILREKGIINVIPKE